MSKYVNFDHVNSLIQSFGWEYILSSFQELNEAINMARRSPNRQVPCPKFGGKKSSTKFRFFKDWRITGGAFHEDFGGFKSGISLIMWLRDLSYREAMILIQESLEGNVPTPVVNNSHHKDLNKDDLEKIRKRLSFYARSSSKIKGTLAETYLKNRGIFLKGYPKDLRFNKVPYFVEEGKVIVMPCLLGLVRDVEGNPVTFQRIYLTNEGNKAGKDCKRLMPGVKSLTGCAIRINDIASETLHVAEGIETACAVLSALGENAKVWATINATLMAKLEIPNGIKRLVIWADKDLSLTGEIKAKELQKRAEALGITVEIMLPMEENNETSIDWLDVIQNRNKYKKSLELIHNFVKNI